MSWKLRRTTARAEMFFPAGAAETPIKIVEMARATEVMVLVQKNMAMEKIDKQNSVSLRSEVVSSCK